MLKRSVPWAAALIACVLSACGGGGGGSAVDSAGAPAVPAVVVAPAVPPVVVAPPGLPASAVTPGLAAGQPLVRLQSDAGDYIGGGAVHEYDTRNAAITLAVRGSLLRIEVEGNERWSGEFQMPGNSTELQAGTAEGLVRYPFNAPGTGGLSWSGEGRGCNTLIGSLTIHSAVYQAGVLRSIDLSFQQRCDGSAAALRGQLRIGPDAMALVTVPQNALPVQPVIELRSDVGDYIGGGAYHAYDHHSARIAVSNTGTRLSITVQGDQSWNADIQLPATATVWTPGTYAGLTRYPFNTAASGGMSWSGEGRGCNQITATVVVERVRYEAGVLRAIDLQFEQHCEGGPAALRGTIRWDADQPLPAPAPQATAPVGLWEPPTGTFAASGNAMYLASAPGDYIGQGYTWWVGAASPAPGTGADVGGTVAVTMTESNGLLQFNVSGFVNWTGQFKAMDGLSRLQPGYYGIVQRYPFHNPARGGLTWSMDSRGCNRASGWFMIDSVTYQGSQLESIDLRFSQHCEGSNVPLRGRIRWRNGSTSG